MPDWLDTPSDVLVVTSILTAILAGLVWLIKAVTVIQHETKPNSGLSLRDAVDRIERKLDNHIDWHMNRSSEESS